MLVYWQRFRAESLLGESFAGEKKYADAEPLLLKGYQGTLARKDGIAVPDRRAHLNAEAVHWHLWRVSSDIVERARHPFPAEPVRTLDAIHLASALAVRSVVPGVELLSLDDRIRRAGMQLGFHLQPE